MQSVGQLLLERGWISNDQLAAALRRQEELGGRLGTALLELDAVSEDLLTKVLAEQASAPAAEADDLREIPPEVIEMLPPKVAIHHRAVPFRMARGRVDVAMRDVPDLGTVDELSFVLGKRAVVHVTIEARMYEALERYFGKSSPLRFTHLLERLNRARERLRRRRPGEAEEARPAAEPPRPVAEPPPAPPAAPPEPPAPAPVPAVAEPAAATATEPGRARSSVPLSEDEKKALKTAKKEPAVTPLSLEQVQQALQVAQSAGDIGRALVGFLGQEFLRVLLFRVDHGRASGWMGRSPALDEYKFRNWSVDFSEPSVFLNLHRGGEFFVGTLPAMVAHQELAKCWRGTLEVECAVFPVRVRDRLVCAIYGDRDSLGLAGLDVQLIQRVTAKAAIAFELLIMRRRLKNV